MGSHLLLKGGRASGRVVRGSRGLAVWAVAALLEVSCMSQRVSLHEGLSQGRTPSGREEGGTWRSARGSGGTPGHLLSSKSHPPTHVPSSPRGLLL